MFAVISVMCIFKQIDRAAEETFFESNYSKIDDFFRNSPFFSLGNFQGSRGVSSGRKIVGLSELQRGKVGHAR